MNKKDVEKVENRISFLQQEWESNQQKITQLVQVNQSIQGGIKELKLMLLNLASKEEKEEDPNG